MSFFGGGSAPTPPPPQLPDPLASAPSFASGATKASGSNKIPGFGSTLMTSGSGTDSSNTNVQRKTLLGQ